MNTLSYFLAITITIVCDYTITTYVIPTRVGFKIESTR